MASTNTTSISYLLESVPGVIESNPAFQLLPVTSNSLSQTLTTAVSEAIRSDRQTDDLIVTGADIGGDIGYELSYTPYKPLMVSLLQSDGVGVTIAEETAMATTTTTVGLAASAIDTGRSVGDAIYLSSVADPEIDGGYVITSLITDFLTVTPNIPSIQTDVVVRAGTTHKNGAEIPNSYTFRSIYKNDSAVPYYFYHLGCQVSSMSFTFATGSILSGTMSVMGLTEKATATAESGETEVVIPPYTIMNSVTSIGAISIGGISLGTCKFNSLDLTIDNNINKAESIGTLGACALASYSLGVSGNVSIYFNSLEAYNKFQAASSFSVSLAIVDGDENLIGVNMKKCKFESLTKDVGSKDSHLMESGSFRGLRDVTGNSMVELMFSDV